KALRFPQPDARLEIEPREGRQGVRVVCAPLDDPPQEPQTQEEVPRRGEGGFGAAQRLGVGREEVRCEEERVERLLPPPRSEEERTQRQAAGPALTKRRQRDFAALRLQRSDLLLER